MDNSAETYVCNGPFKITQMNMGESFILEKNENYWDAGNVTLEKLTYRYILDTSTALLLMKIMRWMVSEQYRPAIWQG